MRLFDIDPDDQSVLLNKVWIMLIPEFAELLKRDKGSEGDYRGDKKLKARKEFTFIYFYCDFSSPITDWADDEREKEALHYAGLKKENLDAKVQAAITRYEKLQLEGSRSLRTYKALLKTQDAMDAYFESLDFTEKDKKGELVNSPDKVAITVERMDKMHTSISNFRKKVEIELKDKDNGIRGTADLGDGESSPSKVRWDEQEVIKNSDYVRGEQPKAKGTFSDLNHMIREQENKNRDSEFSEEELKEA